MSIPADLVYFVRPGDYNEELRFSLRSLANLPHKRVWIIGHTPDWVQDVWSIPGNLQDSKWRNVPDNLRIACEAMSAREFVVMNDDFFVTAPTDDLPPLYRGELRAHIERSGRGTWRASLRQTLAWAKARGVEPLSYELHVPVVVDRRKLLAAVEECLAWPNEIPPQWRSVYGMMWGVEAALATDGKVKNLRSVVPAGPFTSSEDTTFRGAVRPRLEELFPNPSPYERTIPGADTTLGETMSTTFTCTRYPALAARIDGRTLKFRGGRLTVSGTDVDAVRDFGARRPEYAIKEATATADTAPPAGQKFTESSTAVTAPAEPEASSEPWTTQQVLDYALEQGILDGPMEAAEGVSAEINDEGILTLVFADESVIRVKDGQMLEDNDGGSDES